MAAIAKRQKLHEYIDIASNHDIDELLEYIETGMKSDLPYDKWDDPEFIAELDRRVKNMESGSDKGHTWEEVKARAALEMKRKNQG